MATREDESKHGRTKGKRDGGVMGVEARKEEQKCVSREVQLEGHKRQEKGV